MQRFLLAFEKTLFILSLVILVLIPLYPKIPLFSVSKTFVSIRAEDFFIALVYFFWGIYLLLSGKWRQLLPDKIFQLILLFFFIGALSLYSAIFLTQTIEVHLGLLHFLRRVEVMMFLPFFALTITSKRRFFLSLALLAVAAFLVGLYALGQQYLRFPVITTTTSELSKGTITYVDEWTRVNSTFAGHYDLAVFMVGVLAVLTAVFFALKSYFYKVGAVLLAGLSAYVLLMTAARLSFVAAILGIISALILTGNKRLILLCIAAALIVLVYPSNLRDRFLSTFTVLLNKTSPTYTAEFKEQEERQKLNISTLPGEESVASLAAKSSRISTVSSDVAIDIVPGEPTNKTELGVYRSFAIRFDQEWPRAVRALIKNPFLGTGYSSLGLATDNDLLRSLGEVGILGTLAFGLILIEVWKRVWQNYKLGDKFFKYFSAGVLSLMVAFLTNALFIDIFEASKIASLFWIVTGIALALRRFS